MYKDSALTLLSNEKLIKVYNISLGLSLDKEFIALLVEEVNNRGIVLQGMLSESLNSKVN